MKKTLTHKGFTGSVEPQEDGSLYGKVLGIDSLVMYDGDDMTELETKFREIVDFYIDCERGDGRDPYPYHAHLVEEPKKAAQG